MARKGLSRNGGWRKDNIVIIIMWKMKKVIGIGYSGPGIIVLINFIDGSFMDFLREK